MEPVISSESTRRKLVDVAARIGDHLVETARWNGGGCTWRIEGLRNSLPSSDTVGSSLYSGTAGIGLFMAELAAVLNSPDFVRVADGAINHAVSSLKHPTDALGFYTGQVGIAYAAGRIAALDGSGQHLAYVPHLVTALRIGLSSGQATDVFSGAAGFVAPLLAVARQHEFPALEGMAASCGDYLIRRANKSPCGWSWPVGTPPVHLTGYAHGSSGCAHAFLELFAATGQTRFLEAADSAMSYERAFMDAEACNWLDLRSLEMQEYAQLILRSPRSDANVCIPTSRRRFSSQWCHGAAGIGLVRLRAFELVAQSMYRDEAIAAVERTAESITRAKSLCLCHGVAGNIETLIAGLTLLPEELCGHSVRSAVEAGIERMLHQTAGPTAEGTLGAFNPGLMLGSAGIGLCCLRLGDPRIPSVLFPKVRDAS